MYNIYIFIYIIYIFIYIFIYFNKIRGSKDSNVTLNNIASLVTWLENCTKPKSRPALALPVWCHPASAVSPWITRISQDEASIPLACASPQRKRLRSQLLLPAQHLAVRRKDRSRRCSGLSALGPHIWHMSVTAAGWPHGFCSRGKSGSRSCWKTGAWLCKNELVLESTRRVLSKYIIIYISERGTGFCPRKGRCAKSITEHHFGTDKLWRGWWHVQATSRTGTGRHAEERLFTQQATSRSSAQTQGTERPARSCSGSRGTKHRAPTFSLCLSWLKRQPTTAFVSHLTSTGIALYLVFTDTSPSDRAPRSRLAEAVGGVCFLPSKSLPFKTAQPLTQLYLASITTHK